MSNHLTQCLSFFLYILISIIKCELRQLIKDNGITYEIPITMTHQLEPLIKICLGTPLQCFNFKIATNVDISFINHHSIRYKGFDPTKSSTFKQTSTENTVHYGLSSFEGQEVYDVMEIIDQGIKDPHFKFVLVDEVSLLNYEGILGLGPGYRAGSSTLIHSLYINHYITSQQFLISFNKKLPNGSVLVGEVGLDKHLKSKRCHLLAFTNGRHYECEIKRVIYFHSLYFNDTRVYPFAHSAIFSPGTDIFLCPREFFEHMKLTIFKDLILHQVCEIEKDYQEYEKIVCTRDVFYQTFGQLIFILGKWNIKVSLTEIFQRQRDDRFKFKLMHQPKINSWLFGHNLFLHYAVLFDLDRDTIHIRPNRESSHD